MSLELENLREKINVLDNEILKLFGFRFELAEQVLKEKITNKHFSLNAA